MKFYSKPRLEELLTGRYLIACTAYASFLSCSLKGTIAFYLIDIYSNTQRVAKRELYVCKMSIHYCPKVSTLLCWDPSGIIAHLRCCPFKMRHGAADNREATGLIQAVTVRKSCPRVHCSSNCNIKEPLQEPASNMRRLNTTDWKQSVKQSGIMTLSMVLKVYRFPRHGTVKMTAWLFVDLCFS